MLTLRLKQLRLAQGLTQTDLANATGYTQGQIGRWENGDNIPSAEVIATLATTLNVTADYLLGLVDTPNIEMNESNLSADELQLIMFLRSGLLEDALETMTALIRKK